MKHLPYRIAFLVLIVLALTACGGGGEDVEPTVAAVATVAEQVAPAPTDVPAPTEPAAMSSF